MGIAAGIAAAGLAASVGGQIAGGGGPSFGGAGGGSPFLYQPTGQPQQDKNYQALLNSMLPTAQSLPGQLIPQYQQASQNIINNPYAGLAQQGANQGASLAPGIAQMQLGGANALYNAGNSVLGTAFDPQSALYNRTQQQLVDQMNAANAASGVSGPAAAGLEQQGLTNFNIDWQNNLLNRQIQGATSAGRSFAGASDLAGLAPQTLAAGSNLPYATFLGQQQSNLGGLQALSTGVNQSFAPAQSLISDIDSYLGLGQNAGAAALAGQQTAFGENQILGQQLSSTLNNPALTSSLNSLFAPSQYNFANGYGSGADPGAGLYDYFSPGTTGDFYNYG